MNSEKAFETIEELDRHFKSKEKFIISGINVWNLFRQLLFEILTGDRNQAVERFSDKHFKMAFIKNIIKSYFKEMDIKNIKFLGFGSTMNRRFFRNSMFNIFLDWMFLPEINIRNNSCIIELISPSTPYHFKNSFSKKLVYEEILIFKILFLAQVFEKKIKDHIEHLIKHSDFPNWLKNEKIVGKMFANSVAKYISAIKVYKKYLRRSKARAIFIVNYYSTLRRAIVKAAKDLGIKVVEIQHGLISPTHVAYIQKDPKNFDDVPDYVLLFGDFYKDIILNYSELFREDQLFVVGNYYIETVKNAPPDLPDDLKKLKKGKKPIILLTSQTIFSRDVYKPYIEKILNTRKYHLIIKNHPGDLKDKFKIYENHPDVTVISDPSISLYELLKIVDIHITVNSTSAIEALMFGVPSLILRYMGYEKVIQFLIDGKNVIEVDVDNLIENLEKLRKIRVGGIGNKFLRSNFLDNIKVFLQVLGG